MQELPYDVWRLIASYIPLQLRFALGPVNRPFLHAALSVRYERLDWINSYEARESVKRMQDPYIAQYVHCLRIDKLLETVTVDDMSKSSLRMRSKWGAIQKTLVQGLRKLHILQKSRSTKLKTNDDVLQVMTVAVANMTAVDELHIYAFPIPFTRSSRLYSFLSAAQGAFSDTLSKLVLSGCISHLPDFLSLLTFHNLDTLELAFWIDPFCQDGGISINAIREENKSILVRSVAPFINRLQRTLRNLKISSNSQGDHSPFFMSLSSFPNLESFILQIHFNQDTLSDPTPISRLLNGSATNLKTVKLEPYRDRNVTTRLGSPNLVSRSTWLSLSRQLLANTNWLSKLESLSIPALDQATTVDIIRNMPQTLTTLSLVDQFAPSEDITNIIGVLGEFTQLRFLKFEVEILPSSLASLIADTLPFLYSLTIIIGSHQDWKNILFSEYDLAQSSMLSNLSIYFYEEMDNARHTSIPETYEEEHIMNLLSEVFWPDVRTFKQRDRKQFHPGMVVLAYNEH